jgi:hypothetical protein
MICPECKAEGETSQIIPLAGLRTDMAFYPYFDEVGSYHSHDPNYSTMGYECSRGHKWNEKVINKCPDIKCDYGREGIDT